MSELWVKIMLVNLSSTKVDFFSLSADIRSCSEYYKKRCCVGGWREDKVEENNQSRDVTEDSIETSPFTTTIQPAYVLSFLNIESCIKSQWFVVDKLMWYLC